ncbi:MAG: hypothetical protein ACI8RD_006789 [Bacillariaceae sp.]|jgi:hypothetical protein
MILLCLPVLELQLSFFMSGYSAINISDGDDRPVNFQNTTTATKEIKIERRRPVYQQIQEHIADDKLI